MDLNNTYTTNSLDEVKYENFINSDTDPVNTYLNDIHSNLGFREHNSLYSTQFVQRPINSDNYNFFPPGSQNLDVDKPCQYQADASVYLNYPITPFTSDTLNHTSRFDVNTLESPLASVGSLESSEKITNTCSKSLNSFPGLYSSSGFDMVGILSRVAHRPNPQIAMGAVDMSCAFLVVDACRFDFPIIYASDSFERLSGYQSPEIIGQNCRFLQSPDGRVSLGSRRRYTDNNAVHNIRTHVSQGKEFQVSIVNYKKNGQPFINLITIIPIAYEGSDITHFVGFQVNMIEQPNDILQKMKDGTYIVNYNLLSIPPMISTSLFNRPFDGYHQTTTLTASNGSSIAVSPEVYDLMGIRSSPDEDVITCLWNQMLIDNSEDFIHVVTLKGVFLYCSPSCKKMLGYEPDELIGQNVSYLCSPGDLVPVMREIKESASSQDTTSLCYRIRRKDNSYIWFEAQGKLHSDQAKGRKCVVLVGRTLPIYKLSWEALDICGGLTEDEFWGKLTTDGTYLYATSECQRLLGLSPEELVGTSLYQLVKSDRTTAMTQALQQAREGTTVKLRHTIQNGKGQYMEMISTFYPGDMYANSQKPGYILCQSKMLDPKGDEQSSTSSTAPYPQTNQIGNDEDNIFNMLHVTGSTTWQYELHQLRLANQNLRDEIDNLTKASRRKRKRTNNKAGLCTSRMDY
ncbi:hypothetical protein K7432_002746 [Basidiobolus ranarum]|uniref:PAS domain-containing protein n=1 Tax=Basidiobolus ranarum TaxID=34480 RepID=A0ABR2W798_9FUNG